MGTKVPALKDLVGRVVRLPALAFDEEGEPIQKGESLLRITKISPIEVIGDWLNEPDDCELNPRGFDLDPDIFFGRGYEILTEEEVEALGLPV